ncbi:MAG: ABC transporter permease subunit [Rhodobacteraceae bacterium]|nr:ABC transporter permease subunit [Paracoccaceae bacterium]
MLTRYVIRRIGIGFIQLLCLVIAVFFLIRLLPADPVSRFVGLNSSAEAYAQAEANLGLDRPVFVQLGHYLGLLPDEGPGLLQGSLGTSWVTGSAVSAEIGQKLPITLELLTLAFFFALIVSVPVGMLAALNPGGMADKGVFVYSLFAGLQPEFWWGLLFVYLFFFTLGIAPAPLGILSPLTSAPPAVTGFILIDSLLAGRPKVFVEAAHHYVLPVSTMVFILSGPIIKMVRQNMVRALGSDFVLYARCTGLPRWRVALYALRAAIAPSMTLIGILYGFMLGGAVLIESVFSLGGLGQYAIRSILAFDYPAIQGVILVITAISLMVYLALDLIHAVVDPRVTF